MEEYFEILYSWSKLLLALITIPIVYATIDFVKEPKNFCLNLVDLCHRLQNELYIIILLNTTSNICCEVLFGKNFFGWTRNRP